MAWTAHKVPLPELADAPEELDRKARLLAELVRERKHFIVFTGAGISTSAGIPDFRGPEGAWTLQAQGRQRTTATVDTLQAIPTPTHMALVELQNRGIMKYLVSQNCDGLHRRSGILPDKISELHGNNNLEVCKKCGKEYLRDFRTRLPHTPITTHLTGRNCTVCSSPLHDTIINFTETLPELALQLAFDHAAQADLCLVLGSSLTVTPANQIPEAVVAKNGRSTKGKKAGKDGMGRGKAKLVICNLQDTPLDGMADLRVYAKSDELMERVMRELGVEIPKFVLRRRLAVRVEDGAEGRGGTKRSRVLVEGVDVDGTAVSFLRSVRLVNNRRVVKAEPFVFDLRGGDGDAERLELRLELEFMGHYGEPSLELVHELRVGEVGDIVLYVLEYDPGNGKWVTVRQPSGAWQDGM